MKKPTANCVVMALASFIMSFGLAARASKCAEIISAADSSSPVTAEENLRWPDLTKIKIEIVHERDERGRITNYYIYFSLPDVEKFGEIRGARVVNGLYESHVYVNQSDGFSKQGYGRALYVLLAMVLNKDHAQMSSSLYPSKSATSLWNRMVRRGWAQQSARESDPNLAYRYFFSPEILNRPEFMPMVTALEHAITIEPKIFVPSSR